MLSCPCLLRYGLKSFSLSAQHTFCYKSVILSIFKYYVWGLQLCANSWVWFILIYSMLAGLRRTSPIRPSKLYLLDLVSIIFTPQLCTGLPLELYIGYDWPIWTLYWPTSSLSQLVLLQWFCTMSLLASLLSPALEIAIQVLSQGSSRDLSVGLSNPSLFSPPDLDLALFGSRWRSASALPRWPGGIYKYK